MSVLIEPVCGSNFLIFGAIRKPAPIPDRVGGMLFGLLFSAEFDLMESGRPLQLSDLPRNFSGPRFAPAGLRSNAAKMFGARHSSLFNEIQIAENALVKRI